MKNVIYDVLLIISAIVGIVLGCIVLWHTFINPVIQLVVNHKDDLWAYAGVLFVLGWVWFFTRSLPEKKEN